MSLRMHSPCRLRIGLALMATLFATAPAWADADDTFTLTAGTAVQHDDNIFRLSSSTDPNTTLGKPDKADDITSASLALKLNKRYSLQRFELDAGLVNYRYRTFDYLNFTAKNYAAAWRWSLSPYLHGNLISDRKEALNNFGDFTGYGTRNLRTDENQRFDGVLEVGGAWRLLGGIAQATRTNSQVFLEEGDNRLNSIEGGLRYDFGVNSSLSYVARGGRGEYFNRSQPVVSAQLDNAFTQRENEVRLNWPAADKTSMNVRAARISRTHAHFSERDYAGNVGNIGLNWTISDKTSLAASLGREMGSYQSATSSYVIIDRFTLNPYWQISAKTALRGRYDYAHQDYRGPITSTGFSGRIDTLHSTLVALEWQPLRSLSLSASLKNDRRGSNQPGLDYDSTTAGVAAQISF